MQLNRQVKTTFLSVSDVRHLIEREGLYNCLAGMAQAIESDFLHWKEFRKSPRTASHTKDGVIELMPISNARQFAFKYVNGHPYNHRFGLPTVMAFGVLADVATGAPHFISELTLTTALRTAATSAVAARALARPGSKIMAVIGNGAQSEFQVAAFAHLLGIQEFRLYDISMDATRKLVDNMRHMGLDPKPCANVASAVKGADIVTTLTADKNRATVITPTMIEPGMHLNAVGGDCPGKTEVHPDVLRRARVFVEYEPQTRMEGEIQQMPAHFEVTELWQVLARQAPGRSNNEEVTLFDSVGFALEDFSTLRYWKTLAGHWHVGQRLDLVPQLEDPRNLFACLRMGQECEV